jgi:predicted nucleotidyltransferase
MGVDETLLNEIVRRVLSVAHPDRIILFGSAATGQMTKDSDIDLLVVEPALANTHERRVEIRSAVGDIGYPVDVIVMRTERFERTKRWIGGIAYPANKYGRVIYEAA